MDGALLERQPSFRGRLGFTIQGASRAAEYTGLWIPEWGLLLDCGLPTRVQPRAVLCTHTHTDHVAFLGRNCMNRPDTFNVYCHADAVEPLRGLLTATARLRACSDRVCWNSALCPGKLVPLAPEEGYRPLCVVDGRGQTESRSDAEARPAKRARGKPEVPPVGAPHPNAPARCLALAVRAVRLRHSVPTHGYVVAEMRRRLLPHFKGWSQAELDAARRDGVVLDAPVPVPLLAYLCDCSSESAAEAIRGMRDALPRAVVVECTYIDDADADEARRRRHVLWSQLRPVVEEFPAVQFVLIHFSKRYTGKRRAELTRFAASLPSNVFALI
jgi:ribonuclease BN (tRNA processing enzyme)